MFALAVTVQILLALLLPPLLIGVIRKVKARMQNRKGASILQPFRELTKLFRKDSVISKETSWVFKLMPWLLFAISLLVALSVPLASVEVPVPALSDVIVLIYLLALGTFAIATAALDQGSGFSGMGASREMLIASLAEPGLLFSSLSVALVAGSTSLPTMVAAMAHGSAVPAHGALLFGLLAFFIGLLAENARFPFDNPSTHLELTMVHEAMILEYAGRRLALVEWASALKLFAFLALGANLFFPWGIATALSVSALAIGVASLIAKVLVLAVVIAVIESTIAKLRLFRLPDLLLTSFVLALIAIGLTSLPPL